MFYLKVLTDNWYGVRHVWEEHISFLGRRNCSVFKVTAELTYGKDPEDFELESAGFAKDVAISKVLFY